MRRPWDRLDDEANLQIADGSTIVAESRLVELRSLVSADFDFRKVVRLCEEINSAISHDGALHRRASPDCRRAFYARVARPPGNHPVCVLLRHSLRATGVTDYLKSEGTLEHAQNMAAHSSPRTTKLYDRRSDDTALDE